MSASKNLASHFQNNLGVPVTRQIIQSIANQLDYMKRIRRNGGARDILDPLGIALLWGKGDANLIQALGLGPVTEDEFISYRPANSQEKQLIRQNGHPIA